MRRTLSATVLIAAAVASVATSEVPTTTTVLQARSTALDAHQAESFTIDVLASQDAPRAFEGAVMVSASVEAPGAATVTATLSVLDRQGSTELARDTVVVTEGVGGLFLFDDLGAFAACPDAAACDQAFQVVFHSSGHVDVDWTFEAELYGPADPDHRDALHIEVR